MVRHIFRVWIYGNVWVSDGPVSINISAPADIEIDQMLKLSCEAESTPTANFTWMRGTEKIGFGPEFSKKAMVSDSGEYTCVAVNNITKLELRAVHSITVKGTLLPFILYGRTCTYRHKHRLIQTHTQKHRYVPLSECFLLQPINPLSFLFFQP